MRKGNSATNSPLINSLTTSADVDDGDDKSSDGLIGGFRMCDPAH